MNVIPFVHEGLGNTSYLVGTGNGGALLVDPDRSVQRYLDAAAERGWRIDSVLETHLHADFVSGAHETAAATGAKLFIPAGARSELTHCSVEAGRSLRLDGMEIEAIASPGHTPEHVSYVARRAAHPTAFFSGGSLVVGGAARTDLIAADMTEQLTRAQYRTIKTAFAGLPDDTPLYPTHGGGSFCSAGRGGERTSTLGAERATNPLLAFDDEEEFVRWFPTTFPSTPAHYFRMRAFNQAGPRLRRDIQTPPVLSPADFNELRRDAVVIDARPIDAYAKGHIPGSISIAFRDVYAVWLGWLVPADATLFFVAGDTPVERLVDESMLVGYEQFAGVLAGGVAAWAKAGLPLASATLVNAPEARRWLADGASALDVREPDEFLAGHLPGAIHVPLGQLAARIDEIPHDRPIVAYCGHGERASTAASLLERSGRSALLNLDGGTDAWRAAGYALAS